MLKSIAATVGRSLLVWCMSGVALAAGIHDAQSALAKGDWQGAKQTLTTIMPQSCETRFLLGYATANLGDGEGTARAELSALPCLRSGKAHQDAIDLLRWSIDAMAKERLGPPKYPWVQNPYTPTNTNIRRAQREGLVKSMSPYIPSAGIDFVVALASNACDTFDLDYMPSSEENNACLGYDSRPEPVPHLR